MSGAGKESAQGSQPRITYHASNRTFDRLFREDSLDEMKDVVRRKLGLPQNAAVMLTQDRGGQMIDLEDDDDFDAFLAVAHSVTSVNVKVEVRQPAESTDRPHTISSVVGNIESRIPNDMESTTTQSEDGSTTNQRKRKVAFEGEGSARLPSVDVEQVLPPSKRRRGNAVPGSKQPEVDDHNSLTKPNGIPVTTPSPDRTSTTPNVPDDDGDVSMEPSTIPPRTVIPNGPETAGPSGSDTSEKAAPSKSASDTPALLDLKKRKKRKEKGAENTAEQEEAVDSTQTGEKPEKKKRKKKSKLQATTAESDGGTKDKDGDQDQVVEDEAEKPVKGKKKRKVQATTTEPETGAEGKDTNQAVRDENAKTEKRKRKPKSQAAAKETETGNQEKDDDQAAEGNDKEAESFPRDLAKAISKSADEHEKAEKNEKKKRRKSEATKPDLDKSGKEPSASEAGPEEEPAVGSVASKKNATTAKSKFKTDKTKSAGDLASGTAKNDKKRRQSVSGTPGLSLNLSAMIQETVRRKQQERSEQEASSASPVAPIPAPEPISKGKGKGKGKGKELEAPPSKPPAPKKVPTKQVQEPESSDSDDDSIKALQQAARKPYLRQQGRPSTVDADLEEVMRGPSARRLTIDNMMRAEVASQKADQGVVLEEEDTSDATRRRKSKSATARAGASDSEAEGGIGDDDEDEDDSTKEDATTFNDASQPPVVHDTLAANETSEESPMIKKSIEKEDGVSNDGASSQSATEPDDESEHGTHAIVAEATRPIEPPVNGEESPDGLVNARETTPSFHDLDNEADPIESPAGSPGREASPIEPPHNSPVKSRMRKRGATASLPVIPAPLPPVTRGRGKAANSQPVSVRELAVRESVVRMTRNRSKLINDTPIRKIASPAPTPEPPSDEEETPKAKPSSKSQVSPGQPSHESDHTEDQGWTTLNVSSPTEPESSFMKIDQLQSSPEPDNDTPLFIPSETQPGFPYSQYQDLQTQNVVVDSESPNDSQDEEEVMVSVTQKKRRTSMASAYRSLTQIASQPRTRMYTPPVIPSTAPQVKAVTSKDLYGIAANAYGDDSDSDSGSEVEKSHIPKSRRAGKQVS